MPHRRNRFRDVACLRFQLLSSLLKRPDPIRSTFRLFPDLPKALLQMLLELLERIVDRCRLKHRLREVGYELSFQPVLTNHDVIRTSPSVSETGTPVLDVAPTPIARNDRHPRTTKPAEHKPAEKMSGTAPATPMSADRARSPLLPNSSDLRLNPLPKLLGDDPPLRNFYAFPLTLRARPTGLSACLRIPLLFRAIPDKNSAIAFVTQHVTNRRCTPCTNVLRARRHRSNNSFGIQQLCNGRKTVPFGIHGKDTLYYWAFDLVDLQFHPAYRGATVLARTSRVFDRDVAVAEDLPSGVHTIQGPAFLPSVNLFAQAHQKLLVHHPVEGE